MTKMVFGSAKPKWLGERRIERTMDFFFFLRSTQVLLIFFFT
jgi:hypothetical protein